MIQICLQTDETKLIYLLTFTVLRTVICVSLHIHTQIHFKNKFRCLGDEQGVTGIAALDSEGGVETTTNCYIFLFFMLFFWYLLP